jgi:hypothetical protein
MVKDLILTCMVSAFVFAGSTQHLLGRTLFWKDYVVEISVQHLRMANLLTSSGGYTVSNTSSDIEKDRFSLSRVICSCRHPVQRPSTHAHVQRRARGCLPKNVAQGCPPVATSNKWCPTCRPRTREGASNHGNRDAPPCVAWHMLKYTN